MSDEEVTTVTIEGYTEILDGGRSVFVGQLPGESKVYIRFFNGELETRLALSFEAAEALRSLLGSISSRGLMTASTWVLVAETKESDIGVAEKDDSPVRAS